MFHLLQFQMKITFSKCVLPKKSKSISHWFHALFLLAFRCWNFSYSCFTLCLSLSLIFFELAFGKFAFCWREDVKMVLFLFLKPYRNLSISNSLGCCMGAPLFLDMLAANSAERKEAEKKSSIARYWCCRTLGKLWDWSG